MLQVAFIGSRYHTPGAPALRAAGQLLAALPPGFSPATGCCPSGLDLYVRSWCAANGIPLHVFTARGRSAASLRARTVRLVHSSALVLVFPLSPLPFSPGRRARGSGSWLAVWRAALAGVPVLVHLPGVPLSNLPCLAGVSGWLSCPVPFADLPGLQLAAPVLSQTSFLNGQA
jgi:hypothetical protein